MTRFMTLALVSGALILGLGTLSVTSRLGEAGIALAETAAEARTVPDMTMGQADAPVTVIEYASFTCPHCASFHATVWPELKANYIDTGKVRFIHREVYFDKFGLWAAMVARCGGEMRYFGIAGLLYEGQRDWIGDQQPATVADNLRKIGAKAGIGRPELDACMADAAMAEAMVATYERNAAADGIEATPTLVINGEKHSNMSYEDLARILDGELAG